MKTRVPKPPSYLRHKTRNKAFVLIRDENGKRRQVYLSGLFNSPESRRAYRQIVAAYMTGELIPPSGGSAERNPGIGIEELVSRFLHWASGYYKKPDGTPTGEFSNFKFAVRPLLALYRDESVSRFGPLKLKKVREEMISHGSARTYINSQVRRLKQIFKWGVAEELVPPTVYHGIQTVVGLKRGRTEAPETDPILPAEWSDVKAVLPKVSRQIAAMIQIQWQCGCRPSEVCQMRTGDIDRKGPIWLYRPQVHKTQHHNRIRTIVLGPKAQQVLKPFLRLDPNQYLFQSAEVDAERRHVMRQSRKSRVQPSQILRGEEVLRNPRRKFKPCFSVSSYNQCIRRACKEAEVQHWSANQLRHACATRLRAELGLEAARTVLGHSDAATTLIYAERDLNLAIAAMTKFG